MRKNAQIWHCKFCNKDIISRRKYFEHLKVCEEKLKLPHDSAGRVILDERTKKGVETRRQLFLNGKLHTTKGKSLSEDHKAAISKGTRAYLQDITYGGARFSVKACSFIDNLNKQNGWNLQHALNGGEIKCGPYYMDGYDKDLNIAFEYDEPKHHYGYNDTLSEHDIIKMQYIKEKLNCRFFRYNEKLDQLYEC